MRRLLLIPAALCASGFTVVTDPNTLAPMVWPSGQVTMVLHQAGVDDVTDGSDVQAMRDALAVWGQPSCTSFSFVDGGTSSTRGDANDGVNRISFLESGWPSGAYGAVALTMREYSTTPSPDIWTEADIIINGQQDGDGLPRVWATDGSVHALDVMTTVVHELGHVLGLQHSPDPSASMYFAARPGQTYQRTLAPDDVAGVCFLYPATTFSCSSDADCPLYDDFYNSSIDTRTVCSAPNCVAGPAGYGADCYVSGDCDDACVRGVDVPGASDPGFCAPTCTVGGSDCPNGEFCTSATGTPRCVYGHDDCISHADCGGGNRVCEVDLDGRFRCLNLCAVDGHCASIAGAVCHGGSGSGNPAGFCRVPGPSADGVACDDGFECASLYCAGAGVQPTCVGEPPPQDGGPPTDGAPPPDGGPGDPGTPGDSPQPADADPGDTLQGGDGAASGDAAVTGPVELSGGCSCDATPLSAGLPFAAMLLLALRRRRK